MGLDMYLEKDTYVKNWDHYSPEERSEVRVLRGGKPHPDINPDRVCMIIEQVAYWRKANAIHRWFVEHVQGGKDDCGRYHVEQEKLSLLVDLCKHVLGCTEMVDGQVHNGTVITPSGREEQYEPGQVCANPAVAKAKLPTASGFFFGSTDYDQSYVLDLEETISQLEPLLQETGDFYYRASW